MSDQDITMEEITIKCENISDDFDAIYEQNKEYDILNENDLLNENDQKPVLNNYTRFEDKDLLEYKFESLQNVIHFMSQFENYTGNKYWKRSTRTIQGANIKRPINRNLFYYEIKYTCVHGGLAFKSRSKGIRKTSSNKMGCPSQITFRASDDGQYLRIKNLNLNHEGHYGGRNSTTVNTAECSDSDPDSNEWDDSVLIKAYDKAVNTAKKEVIKRINEGNQILNDKRIKPTSNKKKPNSEQQVNWQVGDLCRATYSEDGEIYEAIILEIFKEKNSCLVKYLGYGNSETVNLSTLMESAGIENRSTQIENAKVENGCTESECNGSVRNEMDFENQPSTKPSSSYNFETYSNMEIPPAPPLPPQLMAKLPENDTDALSSMLMSWYVSGFHTGYYHGLKHARENQRRSN